MSCKHGQRGKPSVEWIKNGKKQYYCYGFGHDNGELLEVCKNCRKNVIYAQEDLDNFNKLQSKGE